MSLSARPDAFRPDIEGLRAIAILLVVACHCGVPRFAGGFVGVDIFFVLSGYLITEILSRELRETSRIDFTAFYARRARRLLPPYRTTGQGRLLSAHPAGAVIVCSGSGDHLDCYIVVGAVGPFPPRGWR